MFCSFGGNVVTLPEEFLAGYHSNYETTAPKASHEAAFVRQFNLG